MGQILRKNTVKFCNVNYCVSYKYSLGFFKILSYKLEESEVMCKLTCL